MAAFHDSWLAHETYRIAEDGGGGGSGGQQQPLRDRNGRKNGQPTSGAPRNTRIASGGSSSKYAHVPHRDKPPQVVAKRNARERRRVQAVNGAFVRLRKAVPFENNRGKRISKVKTLQYAIDYIQRLQELLQNIDHSQPMHYIHNYYPQPAASNQFENYHQLTVSSPVHHHQRFNFQPLDLCDDFETID